MAEERKAAARKPAAKRSSGGKSAGGTGRSKGGQQPAAGKRSAGGQRSKTIKPTAAEIRQKNQVRAVVLFACAIFLGCLTLIEGDSLWKWAHSALLGLFGGWAVLWPVLMIYVAVITTMEKPSGGIGGKIWLTALIIVLFCATGFIFGGAKINEGLSFFDYIAAL